jgi:hypothetical protein
MHNESMFDFEERRHDSFRVCRTETTVRVEIEGHFVELLPEMAVDMAEHLKRLVSEISDRAR